MTEALIAGRDYPFTDEDFLAIAAIARARFGLNLERAKKQLVYARLARRLRTLGLSDFSEYRARLAGDGGAAEHREMLSALTTNVTQFFRERHHFEFLRADILPGLVARARSGGRVRFWSAGCSAGQEAYSLALEILALCPEAARLDIGILATDIDPVIVGRARKARYPVAERVAIPAAMARFLVESDDATFEVGPSARALVTVGELNLIDRWPIRGPFDAILCRNVAIYFDEATRARLWARFADLLLPGAHLLIGHSERLSGPAAAAFEARGVTTYRKRGAPQGVGTAGSGAL
jgi:chemotaxis protein methyltransferase CheR